MSNLCVNTGLTLTMGERGTYCSLTSRLYAPNQLGVYIRGRWRLGSDQGELAVVATREKWETASSLPRGASYEQMLEFFGIPPNEVVELGAQIEV